MSILDNHEIKVSVVVPVYSVEAYIQQCIDSLINQTLREIEIIFIDDASPDRSASIIKKAQKRDPRISIISNKENRGVAASRNIGIEATRGKYLKIIDSDDFLPPSSLEQQYRKAESDQCDIVFHDAFKFHNEELLKTYRYPERHKDLKDMCGHAAWWYLFKREILIKDPRIKFPEGAHPHEDTAFSFMLISHCKKAEYISKELIYYRQHENMVMNQIKYEKKEQNARSASICVVTLFDFFASLENSSSAIRRHAFNNLLGYLSSEAGKGMPFRIRLHLIQQSIKRFIFQKKITQSDHLIIKVFKIPIFRRPI